MNNLIEFKQVQKKFGEKYAIKELNLSIEQGKSLFWWVPLVAGRRPRLK